MRLCRNELKRVVGVGAEYRADMEAGATLGLVWHLPIATSRAAVGATPLLPESRWALPTNSPQDDGARYADSATALRPYGLGHPLQGLPAGLRGRTLLAGVCLAGDWLRLTPRLSEEVRPCPER